MYKFLNKKVVAACLAVGISGAYMANTAHAEVYTETQVLSDKQQWKFAGLLTSPKAAFWLNQGMSGNNGVASRVSSIEVVSFTFNKGAKEAVRSIVPIPFDKLGVISAYANVTFANGDKQGGILMVDNPGEKEKVKAYWVSAEKISGFLKAAEDLKTGGHPLPAYLHADFNDPEVQNCAAQSFLIRPVGPSDYPFQRWVRCTTPEQQEEIMDPKSLVPKRY
ncbi:hypothetical protein FAI40_03745 [Acetobacteraceae bacterium]|nr:hypothetical protein FAI40_03745 [Acetobacteraceae bacterium]